MPDSFRAFLRGFLYTRARSRIISRTRQVLVGANFNVKIPTLSLQNREQQGWGASRYEEALVIHAWIPIASATHGTKPPPVLSMVATVCVPANEVVLSSTSNEAVVEG